MDRIWAPWRMNYIKPLRKSSVSKGRSGECLFCRIVKEKNDEKNLIIKRNKFSFSVLNKFPYNNGHLLVVAKRHLADITDLNEKEIVDLFNLISESKNILDKALKPQGYNIGINLGKISGAGIEKHLHIHIVPRWLGDTNFMPITASTKVIPQSLDALCKKLKKYGKSRKR